MTGLRCEFNSGRPEASAQLHRIKKKIASMKAFMNQDSDQEASRQDNDDKTFDWPALDYPDMESVIKYVEQRKDKEVRKTKKLWSKRVSQEIMESNVGMESNHQFDVKDHWVYSRNRVSMHAVWARHHTMARSSLFTPCGTNGGSAKTVELLCTRITVGTYVDGQNFIHVDDWNDESAAHNKLENMSTGSTFFHQQNTSNMLAREDMVAGTQEIESDFHNDCSVRRGVLRSQVSTGRTLGQDRAQKRQRPDKDRRCEDTSGVTDWALNSEPQGRQFDPRLSHREATRSQATKHVLTIGVLKLCFHTTFDRADWPNLLYTQLAA